MQAIKWPVWPNNQFNRFARSAYIESDTFAFVLRARARPLCHRRNVAADPEIKCPTNAIRKRYSQRGDSRAIRPSIRIMSVATLSVKRSARGAQKQCEQIAKADYKIRIPAEKLPNVSAANANLY